MPTAGSRLLEFAQESGQYLEPLSSKRFTHLQTVECPRSYSTSMSLSYFPAW